MLWYKKHYLLSACFLCNQRWQPYHEWCSSLWLKFVKKGPIFPTFFPSKKCWEWSCNMPSWAQHCFKKYFLALKICNFQVKSKTTKNTLCNLSEENKISKHEIDLPNFIVIDVIFKQCWYLSTVTKELTAIFWSSYNWRKSKNYYQKG